MRRSTKSLFLAAAILLVACLAAGCSSSIGSSVSSAISSLTSRSDSAGPTATTPASPTTAPASPSVTAPASPTVTVTTTAPPTTVTVTASPSPSPTPSSVSATPTASSSNNLLWLWILLGAAVLIGLIAWIAIATRRHSAKAAGWQSRLIDAYSKGSALHDAMAVAEGPGAIAAADAGARWADIQRRADDLAQTLYALRESAPDDATRIKIADTLTSLHAVRSAMDAERAPGGASPMQAEVVRGRLYAFESSLRALRAPSDQYP